ncbi:hypothetical protein CU098_010731 [Rhizopus stolonifer]|uniref:BTB domain-containing protein n=1 Tax=Rhizopus stolonifer TaxID=4846 RepID=A0A367KQJ3_RHIST|nr:hypothetical protein CU098_010731 [Rhizopus stolonifer]
MVALTNNSAANNGSFPRQSIADLTTDTKSTKGDIPPPLVGASTTVIDDHIYVFGGRIASTRQMTNHLYILHLPTLVWVRHIAPPDSAVPPVSRYFHSATTYLDRYIVIFGGMGSANRRQRQPTSEEKLCALDDIAMFDIESMSWVEVTIPPSIFTPQARYAHLATIWDTDKLIVMGGQDIANQHIHEINVFDLSEMAWIHGGPINASYDAYRAIAFCPTVKDNASAHNGKSTSPFWRPPTKQGSHPKSSSLEDCEEDELLQETPPICLYSNYNFNDLTRELQSFYPMKSAHAVEFTNHAPQMAGHVLPPGLRFPTGCLMGHYFVISGTFLSSTQKGFQIWALNLTNLSWSHVDTGNSMSVGSWNRGLLSKQKYYVLGHNQRDLKDDYSYRRINFDHIAIIDLEAFGIYALPPSTCSTAAQELGLTMLNDMSMSDLTIWTTDHLSLSANSVILAERWPDFAQLLQNQKNPSLQKKHLLFPETYSVTLAFLQFLYTDHLITAQQHQPQILSRLLVLADMYNLERLRQLSTYALHQLLTISTASMVYETATLTFQGALQIRALRIMINAKRMLLNQQQNMMKEPALSTTSSATTQHSQMMHEPMTPQQQDWSAVPMTPSSVHTAPTSSYSSSGSYYSFPEEPQSPQSSYHSVPYTNLRRLAQPSTSPSNSEKIQQRYMYSNAIKSPPLTPKNKGAYFDNGYLGSRSLSGTLH